MGPELGEEAKQSEQQNGRQQWVAVQGAGFGQLTHARFTDDRHLDHLVHASSNDQQRGTQQEIVEHGGQAPTEADNREIALGLQQLLGHTRALLGQNGHSTELRAQVVAL
ncbi:hypothetical protein D3C79_864830 [compost metagenome]